MNSESQKMSATRRVLPVFPLPNTVFFPETSLSLHVFEPRYRDLTPLEDGGFTLRLAGLQRVSLDGSA